MVFGGACCACLTHWFRLRYTRANLLCRESRRKRRPAPRATHWWRGVLVFASPGLSGRSARLSAGSLVLALACFSVFSLFDRT